MLSLMTSNEAHTLERLARMTLLARHGEMVDVAVVTHVHVGNGSIPDPAARANRRILEVLGPLNPGSFGPIGILHEEGFAHEFQVSTSNPELMIANKRFAVEGLRNTPSSGRVTIGGGWRYTQAGAEILSLLDLDPDPDFLSSLRDALSAYGLTLLDVGS